MAKGKLDVNPEYQIPDGFWERNKKRIIIEWRFINNNAREKLKRYYEVVSN